MAHVELIIMGAKGRMGSTLVRLAQEEKNFELVGVVEKPGNSGGIEGLGCPVSEDLEALLAGPGSSLVIDFTSPEASMQTAETVSRLNAGAVIGTTGFTSDQLDRLRKLAKKTRLFWAPNMSVGINVLLQTLPGMVQSLGPDYDLEISEIHHGRKKDAPSGTALKLGECLAEARDTDLDTVGEFCRHGMIGQREKGRIGVQTLRGGDVVGDHTVYFFGPGERIEVTHRAHSRETFAQGALRAAGWLAGQKPGRLYSMQDLLA